LWTDWTSTVTAGTSNGVDLELDTPKLIGDKIDRCPVRLSHFNITSDP